MEHCTKHTRFVKLDQPARRLGFTLLELLIVSVLMSFMMIGIWTLLRSWTRISDRGRIRTERAQLVRSLCDQFRDDMNAVAFRAPRPPLPQGSGSRNSAGTGSSSSGRRSTENGEPALVGGSDWLVLDILQAPNPFYQASPESDTMSQESEPAVVLAPELQRVIYSFQAPETDLLDSIDSLELLDMGDDVVIETGDEFEEPVYGLVRLEMAREQYASVASAESSNTLGSSRSSTMRDMVQKIRELVTGQNDATLGGSSALVEGSSMALEDQTQSIAEMVRKDEVPEVRMVEFRYFDGSSWRTSWNSESEKRLPVAVELRFELEETENEAESSAGGDDTELVDEGLGLEELGPSLDEFDTGSSAWEDESVGMDGELEPVPYERCVVYLGPK